MYDRAPRIISKPTGSTAPSVGPGTYHPRDKTKGRVESYAPFQSMAVRESFLTVSDSLAAAPGPGYYTQEQGFGTDRGKGTLNNKVKRFPSPPAKAPGPGAYTISKRSDWIRKTYPPPQTTDDANISSYQNRDMLRVGNVMLHRQQTAPSIPMPGQNYGYEEGEDGGLKPQVITVGDSTMGPAYYNVSHGETQTTRKYKGIHFGTLKSYRSIFKSGEGPGPGEYDPKQALKQAKSNNSKATNIPRYHELVTKLEEKKAVPGPGQYDVKSQFERPPSSAEDDMELGESVTQKAPFGSRIQRFLSPKINSPASTTYEDPRTAFDSTKRLTGLNKAPFGQTSSRFKVNRQAKFQPGPGAYNDNAATSMATELAKRTVMNGVHLHPFGTTSMRTAPLVKKDAMYMPGPACYPQNLADELDSESPQPVKTNQMPKNSSMFSSTSKRLYSPPAIVTDIPPPGSYDVLDSYSKSQGKLDLSARIPNNTFLSTSERFAPPRDILLEEPDNDNPGPGEYEPQGSLSLSKGGVIGKDNRFKYRNKKIPGPGTYQLSESQMNTVLKGTFNSSLDNPLTPKHKVETKKHTAIVL